MKISLFKLSVLSTAIVSCSAFAQETAPKKTASVLPTIEVQAEEGVKLKTNVVTTEKINKSTETDLRGLLAEEPAINFGGGNGTSQWVTIRGMGQDQINLVVDGGSTDTQIFHHQGRFSLDPSLIKIVQVQKGTGSASAGIGVTNGAIVAKTVDALDLLRDGQNFGFKVNGGYATNDEYSYGASVFGRAGKFDVLVAGNQVDQSNYESGKKDGENIEVNNSGLDKRGLLAKVGFNPTENHRFVLGYRHELNKGVRNLREEVDSIYIPNYNSPRYRELENTQATLEWQGKNMGFIDRADADISIGENKRTEKPNGINDVTGTKFKNANLNLDTIVTENSLLKYGVNYRYQESYPSDGVVSQEKTDIGVYVETVNTIGPVTLTGGLRYDYFDMDTIYGNPRSDGDLNPSLGLIWQVYPDLSINVSHNRATRSPRFGETMLSGTTGRARPYYIAEGTVADHTRSTEVGFNYNRGGFKLDGSYFWTTTEDLGTVNSAMITNQGTLKNNGYEVNSSYRWNGLKLRAGVAYNEPTLNGDTIDRVAVAIPIGRTWTTGVSYMFERPSLEIGWKSRIVQDTSFVDASGTTIKRDGYHVHDIYATWQPLHNDRLNVNFSVNNVADEYYKSHSQRTWDRSLPSAGRDFRVGFNYTF